MLEEGIADIATIEEGAKRAFKIGMGPFQLMNVTGIPIAVHAATTLGRELGNFYAPCAILQAQMAQGKDWILAGEAGESKIQAVIDRFYGVCLGVAAALVDEGVASIEDTDRGAKIGLRWVLGPFEIMNRIGIDKTYDLVKALSQKYADFQMPKILADRKSVGKPFEFNFVDLEIRDRIATITINRPEAMNALNQTVVSQLENRFAQAEAKPEVRAIIFQGAGKAFIGGVDIRYFIGKIKAGRIPDIVAFTRKGHELLLKIENSQKLTIAVLDGLSLGGGSELALACQAIIATPAGSLAFPETGIGIYPGLGGMLRLALHVGVELAKYYVLTGSLIRAADAFEMGIVDAVVEPAEIESEIQALILKGKPDKYRQGPVPEKFEPLARMFRGDDLDKLLSGQASDSVSEELAVKTLKFIGAKAPRALKLANEIMDAQRNKSIPEAIEIELNRLADIFSSDDALEGLSSMGRKRPNYKGR